MSLKTKIITIDGTSGVGKGTLSCHLARWLGFSLLDSGALYRLTALNALQKKLDPSAAEDAKQAVDSLDIEFLADGVFLHRRNVSDAIRLESTGQAASVIATHPEVREKLLAFMRGFVCWPGVVADGRDTGTVVFPNADVKLFLTASPEVRAKRRHEQLKKQGKDVTLSAVFSELSERDRRDSTRTASPLRPAKDAVIIDTGALNAEQVFDFAKNLLVQRGVLPN